MSEVNMKIININGPINSGKTTISKILANKMPKALFIEVDDLLSDEEQERLGLSMQQGWVERTNRLDKIVRNEKKLQRYQTIVFAYPIAKNTYEEWKAWEDENTQFINITLAPQLDVCLQNRGNRVLEEWEKIRIKEMYEQNYHCPKFADLIIDNSAQTPEQTLQKVLSFLS